MKLLLLIFMIIPRLDLYALECSQDKFYNISNIEEINMDASKLVSGQIQFDNIPKDTEEYSKSDYVMGISYYIGGGNERWDKLEGHEDIYIFYDEYQAEKHPMNGLTHGSHAIIKLDQTKNPPKIIYLTKSKQVASHSRNERNKYKNINESLCSLNVDCNQTLTNMNKVVDDKVLESKIINTYKENIINLFEEKLIVDTYHKFEEIKDKVSAILSEAKIREFKSTKEINQFVQAETKKIVDEKIKGRTYSEWKQHLKDTGSSENPLNYIDYNALVGNVEYHIDQNERAMKKKSMFEYCSDQVSDTCSKVNNNKDYIDYFQKRRKTVDGVKW